MILVIYRPAGSAFDWQIKEFVAGLDYPAAQRVVDSLPANSEWKWLKVDMLLRDGKLAQETAP